MTISNVKLGSICSFQSGGTPAKGETRFFGGNIPWITTVALSGGYIDENDAIEWITNEAVSKSAAKIVPANSLMIGTRVGVGKVAINTVQMSTSQDIVSLLGIDESKWNKEYLCRLIQGNAAYLQSQARGATIKGIKIETLSNILVPVIPLHEQVKIAATMRILCDLISTRKQQLSALDTLIKARFVEMFGDPELNPMNWSVSSIGALTKSIFSGWSGNGTQREKQPGEMAVLKVSAVTKGFFIPTECKVLDDQAKIKKSVSPQKGDLLFSRANTREMVGATAVITKDYPELILPDKLWQIRFSDSADVFYMKYILSSKTVREKFSAASTGTSGSMYNVSMDKFRAVQIPLPPIELQTKFSDFVSQVDKSKAAVQKALDEARLLFDSLMQKYFG